MGKFFICHTPVEGFFTENKTYEILSENDFGYLFKSDTGFTHSLTKQPDYGHRGFSYKDFMHLGDCENGRKVRNL